MLTPEDHAKLLRSFEVDRLLKLVALEAKRLHDGHYAILSFTTEYKVAFGIPEMLPWGGGCSYAQIAAMPGLPTLKEALIAALVAGKDFDDYFSGDAKDWWEAKLGELDCGPGGCGQGRYGANGLLYCKDGGFCGYHVYACGT